MNKTRFLKFLWNFVHIKMHVQTSKPTHMYTHSLYVRDTFLPTPGLLWGLSPGLVLALVALEWPM